jgi:hypothetical protein
LLSVTRQLWWNDSRDRFQAEAVTE